MVLCDFYLIVAARVLVGLLGWIVDREPDEGCGGGLVAACLVLNCEVGLGSLEEDGTVRGAVDEGRVGGETPLVASWFCRMPSYLALCDFV